MSAAITAVRDNKRQIQLDDQGLWRWRSAAIKCLWEPDIRAVFLPEQEGRKEEPICRQKNTSTLKHESRIVSFTLSALGCARCCVMPENIMMSNRSDGAASCWINRTNITGNISSLAAVNRARAARLVGHFPTRASCEHQLTAGSCLRVATTGDLSPTPRTASEGGTLLPLFTSDAGVTASGVTWGDHWCDGWPAACVNTLSPPCFLCFCVETAAYWNRRRRRLLIEGYSRVWD